jgi:hypothetical protein
LPAGADIARFGENIRIAARLYLEGKPRFDCDDKERRLADTLPYGSPGISNLMGSTMLGAVAGDIIGSRFEGHSSPPSDFLRFRTDVFHLLATELTCLAILASSEAPMPKRRRKIPVAHYAAMGRVADTWADLEFAIDHIIWHLMRTDQAFGACVTSQMISIHPRSKALLALLSLYEVPLPRMEELKSVLGRAAGLSETRNRLIHDKRLLKPSTGEVIRFEVSAKKDLIFAEQPESVGSLNKFRESVGKIIVEFDTVMQAIMGELNASGGKLRGKLPALIRLPRAGAARITARRTRARQPRSSQA